MKSALKITALSLLVVATLAGCFKGKVDLTINSDDTVDGTMLIAIQSGIGDSLGMSDDDLLGEMTGDVSGDLEGATVEDYNEDGYLGKLYSFENQPLDAFDSGDDGSDISITREGDKFIVDGTWSTEDTDTGGMDPAALGAEFTFSVTFPGKVSDSNGTVSDDGKTVTWNLLDPPDTLHAEGKAVDGGSNMLWILIAVIALLVVAAVVITLLVVRKRGAKAVDAAPAATGAVGAAGGAEFAASAVEAPAAEFEAAPEAAPEAAAEAAPDATPEAPEDTPSAP
jgi:hypothetical protein